MLRFLLWLAAACLASTAGAAMELVGRFDPAASAPPAPWRLVRFKETIPATRYRVREWDGIPAVEASARGSMALLARPLAIDLAKTPVLCWRWRVDAPLVSADLATKAGDDYAARVYVAFKLAAEDMSLSTRAKLAIARRLFGEHVPDAALNYVWDNRHPIGTRRPNAYTERTQMVVARTGAADAGRWVVERRDVLADARTAFGDAKFTPALLALASDTDNTGETARAGFADLHFVARDENCAFPALPLR